MYALLYVREKKTYCKKKLTHLTSKQKKNCCEFRMLFKTKCKNKI